MAIIPAPAYETPFDTVTRLNWAYRDEIVNNCTQWINYAKSLLAEEAELDGQPALADEEYLYKRFKENCEHGMVCGNWQVLKYFSRILCIKLYREMMGEWTYTENDLEMYNYFMKMKVSKVNKCMPRWLKFKAITRYTRDAVGRFVKEVIRDPMEANCRYSWPTDSQMCIIINRASEKRHHQEVASYNMMFIGLFGGIRQMLSHVLMEGRSKDKLFGVNIRYDPWPHRSMQKEYDTTSVSIIRVRQKDDSDAKWDKELDDIYQADIQTLQSGN